jgi:hypothetical protein
MAIKKVKIYTFSSLRPEWLELQYASLKYFIEDEFEFIVYNNAIDCEERRIRIFNECNKLNIKCIEVKEKKELSFHPQAYHSSSFKIDKEGTHYLNASRAFSYAMNYAWEEISKDNNSISCIIDSDMFFINKFNFNKIMSDYDFAFVPQCKGIDVDTHIEKVFHPWTGFMIFNIEKFNNIEEISWSCGIVNDVALDPGGLLSIYLKSHSLRIKLFELYTFNRLEKLSNNFSSLNCYLNANVDFNIDLSNKNIYVNNPKFKKYLNFFSYEKEMTNYLENISNKFLGIFYKFLNEHQTYPQPSCIDFIDSFSEETSEANPFIVHYRKGSNYDGFSFDYQRKKTEFIENLLSTVSQGSINIKCSLKNEEIFYYKAKIIIKVYNFIIHWFLDRKR